MSHLLVAGCYIGVRISVRPSVRPSTFMWKFDIYVKVSILINYKTKQPSNLAWNISLTSWLCDLGIPFSVRPSVRLSVRPSQHLSRSSTFTSKLVFWSTTTLQQPSYLAWHIPLTSWLCRPTTIKPCKVLLLNVLTRQIPWPGDLDLYFGCSDFDIIYVNVPDLLKCKTSSHQTLLSASPRCTDSTGILTRWPWPIFCAPVPFTHFT